MRAPLVALLVLAVVSGLEAEPEEAEGECIWYDICGWDQDYGEDGGNQVHFLNCHYEGPPKPASQEILDTPTTRARTCSSPGPGTPS